MGFYRYLLVIWSVVWTLKVVNASENIASGKATSQSSTLGGWGSSNAVDGCVDTFMGSNCCTHTAIGHTEASWQVDLQTQSVIESVNIIYRDEGTLNRLAGYEIYLSNAQDRTSGNRCHKDTTAALASMSATQNVQCPGVTRYLTIYNDRRVKAKPWYSNDAILELCEVQVNGCPVGMYGNGNCAHVCMNCLSSCDTTSGCDDCGAGYHKSGGSCVPCPSNCVGNKCDSLSGACSDGCNAGFTGMWCRCPVNCKDTSCPTGQCTDCNDGYYGPACTPCPSGCSPDTCDKTSGHCVQCDAGFHGSFCRQPCYVNCKNNVCNQDNGQCTECDDGFYDSFCNQSCPVNCKNNVCNMVNGQCTECLAGYHGSTCTQTCPTNCKDNICIQGNRFCTECAVGYHGDQCDMNCPFNCKDKFCNQTNGRCIGCGPDYHGSDCSLNCPDNCKGHACIQENGQCIECVSGFHGSKCVNMCGYCQDGRCDKDTGTCMTSCIDGLTGHRCDIKVVTLPSKEDDFNAAAVGIGSVFGVVIVALVIVIIVQARRHRSMNNQNTTRSTTMTDISLPSIGQERRAETDGTYAVIGAQERDKNITKMSAGDSSYEQLGYRERDVPHLYETT